ncbi:hypothetical protein ACIQKE_14545 [Streptomyces griseoviridis]|uniref:hypothetical protein n=1 Tax=Streptomyces TaxID=1883 RepID=UPI00247698E1|nr:hypothetical protein [Streptomyces sp. MAA16]
MPVPARLPSWVWVTGLTVGAVAAVAALAVQADRGPHPAPTAAASPTPRPSVSAPASPKPTPTVVPDGSGVGRRIVYSVAQHRVWLVDASDATRRTFAVWPGTIAPDAGSYTVSLRNPGVITGSDGVKIEHILYFGKKAGVNLAFSNAVDGSSPPPAPAGTGTGGIRLRTADGTALWAFGTTGTKVAVVD